MVVRYINRTHKRLTLADGISLPANSTLDIEPIHNKRIDQLVRMDLIRVIPVTGSRYVPSNDENSEVVTESRHARMRATARAARAAKFNAAAVVPPKNHSATTKATSSNKTSNTKGK